MSHNSTPEPPNQARTAEEIARRALALFGVVGLALGAPKADTISWLKEEQLWDELTPREIAYVSARTHTKQQTINASWRSEALLVLVWALDRVKSLPALSAQCDTRVFKAILPPFADLSTQEFISSARRRGADELTEMADDILDAHWRVRDAKLHGKSIPAGLDVGVIQERHHAINWVNGYDDLPWDEITTDT